MKKIGMLGGMSWESTLNYYKTINEGVKKRLGGLHSAKILLSSVDFEEIEKLQHEGNWEKMGTILTKEAKAIEQAGADFLMICTNTMHKIAPLIQEKLQIEILHIADATAKVLVKDGIKKVALLGTKFTMSEEFYKERLQNNFGIDVVVPTQEEQASIHKIIYEELCLGVCKEESKDVYLKIIQRMSDEDQVQGVILGCTEIAMLIKPEDLTIKSYDTTALHAKAAVNKAID